VRNRLSENDAYRRTIPGPEADRRKIRTGGFVLAVAAGLALAVPTLSTQAAPTSCGALAADPNVIWCDDFEDGVALSSKYFDYDSNGGDFVPVAGTGINGSTGLRVVWQPGETEAGSIKRMFGRNPVRSQSHSSQDFRDIYYRQYLRTAPGWSGNPYKVSRATSFATSGWAQAMIAHVWGDGTGDSPAIDPATGINAAGQLATMRYNDFANLQWLGLRRATTPIFAASNANRWTCVESHVRLNSPGSADGVFELFVDGQLEASRTNLNWVGPWQGYGINAVFFENHWNGGAPGERIRFIDSIAISTRPLGCSVALPRAPANLRILPGLD